MSLPLGLAALGTQGAFAQTEIFNTLLEGAVVLGIMADGSVRVRLIDGSQIILQPGTYSLQDDKIYVEPQVASAIQTSTIDSATANSNSMDDLPVFTSSGRVEAKADQDFLINVDANIAGDSSGLTYTIVGGGAADKLVIDPVTGVITVKPGASLETADGSTQMVVVRVSNGQGDFAEQAIVIETPSAASAASSAGGLSSFGFGGMNPFMLAGAAAGTLGLVSLASGSEDSPAPAATPSAPSFSNATATANLSENATVVTGYQASAGSGASYAITGMVDNTGLGLVADDFAISGSGNLAYVGAQNLDLEQMSSGSLTLTITATLNGKTASQTVNMTILDEDEFDVAFTSTSPTLALGVDENFEGDIAGYTAAAADDDATDGVTYSITGVRYTTDADATGLTAADFSISSDGTISIVKSGGLNFEALTDSLVLTVTATSDDGSTATQDVEISVLNKNEAPDFSPDVGFATVDETFASHIYNVVALDEDNTNTTVDALFYQIFAGNDDAIFTIDSATGRVSFVDPNNEANDGSYTLSIRATDNNGSGDAIGNLSDEFTLNVTVVEVA